MGNAKYHLEEDDIDEEPDDIDEEVFEIEGPLYEMKGELYEMDGGRGGRSGGRSGGHGGRSGGRSGRGGRTVSVRETSPSRRVGRTNYRSSGPAVRRPIGKPRHHRRFDHRFGFRPGFVGSDGSWGWGGWWPTWLRYNYWWPSYDCVDYATNQCLGAPDYQTCFNAEYRNCAWGNPWQNSWGSGPVF